MKTTIYTLPDCIQCDMTKKYFTKYDMEFDSVDISTDEKANELVQSLGYKQAPVVVSDKFHWSGFRPDKINALHLLLMNKGVA